MLGVEIHASRSFKFYFLLAYSPACALQADRRLIFLIFISSGKAGYVL
jgi:hypothetical protein